MKRKSHRIEGRWCTIAGDPGHICNYMGEKTEVDHVKTRGSGGPDIPRNKMPICFGGHTEKGQKGVGYMAAKYKSYKKWLLDAGWSICAYTDKWRL